MKPLFTEKECYRSSHISTRCYAESSYGIVWLNIIGGFVLPNLIRSSPQLSRLYVRRIWPNNLERVAHIRPDTYKLIEECQHLTDKELMKLLPAVMEDQAEQMTDYRSRLCNKIKAYLMMALVQFGRVELAQALYPELYRVSEVIKRHDVDTDDAISKYMEMRRGFLDENHLVPMLATNSIELFDLYSPKSPKTLKLLLFEAAKSNNLSLAQHIWPLDSWLDLIPFARTPNELNALKMAGVFGSQSLERLVQLEDWCTFARVLSYKDIRQLLIDEVIQLEQINESIDWPEEWPRVIYKEFRIHILNVISVKSIRSYLHDSKTWDGFTDEVLESGTIFHLLESNRHEQLKILFDFYPQLRDF